MISKLQNPITAMALSLVLSVVLGVALCWRAAGPLLELAAAARPKVVVSKKEKGWDFWTIEMENLDRPQRGARPPPKAVRAARPARRPAR